MKILSRIILIVTIFTLLNGCTVSSIRLSSAEEKIPVSKVNIKVRKYVEQLYSLDATERAWAVYNIGKLHEDAISSVPYLVAMLGDLDVAVMTRYISKDYTSATTTTPADEAVKALARIGRPSVKALNDALKDSDNNVVLKAIKAVGLIEDGESIKPLVAFLSHDDKRIRLEAANSLSHYKNPWVAEYLLKSLKHKDPAVRSTALYALGKLKSPVTVPALLATLNDIDPSIRSQALYVLSSFRDERVIQPLINLAQNKRINYRIEVITALGSIRDYRVIEALIGILKDNDKNVRLAAADALAQITEVNLGVNQGKWKRWWKNKLKRSRRN